MLKKIFSLFLLTLFWLMQTSFVVTADSDPQNLKEYLSTNNEIMLKYDYPSMPLNICSAGYTLPAGTPIILQAIQTIAADAITTGSNVEFRVVKDVIVDGKTLIKAGAVSRAQVSFAKKKGYIGIPGEITISDFSVNAVDGTYIPLNATLSSKGEDKIVMAAILTLVCLPFALIKGGEAIIPAGMTKSVYTFADVGVRL